MVYLLLSVKVEGNPEANTVTPTTSTASQSRTDLSQAYPIY